MIENPALYAPVIALFVCGAAIVILLRHPTLLLDQPNQRSLHQHPVPRTGGIAIVLGAFPCAALLIPAYAAFCAAAMAIALLSLADDWRRLSPAIRFGVQILIAALFVNQEFAPFSMSEKLFIGATILWLANLYNFMDGSDGLAGGMAAIGFSACALGAGLAENTSLAALCASIALASAVFLFANFHPAKIFMGDVGAITLGFSAGAIGVMGWSEGTWSPFFPIFVFSPFIADASLTLLRRVLLRQRFWEPHRDHYFQKLIRMGWGHRKTALAEYAVMAAAAGLALATQSATGITQLSAIVAWGVVLIVIAALVDRRWNHTHRGQT